MSQLALGLVQERLGRRWLQIPWSRRAGLGGSEFQDLADDGLVMLATDRPIEAAAAMTADDTAIAACGG